MSRDNITITIKSGRGGNGSEAVVKRTKIKMVPDGGDGGKGGDVVFIADTNVADLEEFMFNKVFQAEPGGAGGSNQRTGANGKDLVLRVPCGTTIMNTETGLLIRRLSNHGDFVIAARGGDGGFGNMHKRSGRPGREGEAFTVNLDFILPLDVCIVGFPNTGKSRLLSMITNSKVKVADHPFSTQRPSLGTYVSVDFDTIVFCEIPSLIAGSCHGKGLGNKFLKHAANAKIMLYLLDPTSRFSHGVDEEYKCLREELAAYDPALNEKTVMIVINKIDAYNKDLLKDMRERFGNLYPTFLVSLETKEGLPELMSGIKQVIREVSKP